MRFITTLVLWLMIIKPPGSFAQEFRELPEEFVRNAYKHISELCDFGIRRHDLPSGSKSISFIKGQFESYGLTVKVDTFYFEDVKYRGRKIIIEGDSIRIQTFCIRHDLGPDMKIKGECLFLDENALPSGNINDKIVFTVKSNNSLLLTEYSPKATLVLRYEDFLILKHLSGNTIEVTGREVATDDHEESYNVIATYENYDNNKKDLLITAHWDSEKGPGADDNASGVATILELARYFKEYQDDLKYNLVFIAFGAEELGLIGSKSYILKYTSEILNNCVLNINMDAVAGGPKPYIEMRNPLHFKESDNSEWLELITYPGSKYLWFTSFLEVYRNSSSAAIYPAWMVEDIHQAMKKLEIKYAKAQCCSGADHRSFAYLDIPVMYLGMTKDYEKDIHHTPNDIPKEYFKENLNVISKTAQGIIIEVCR